MDFAPWPAPFAPKTAAAPCGWPGSGGSVVAPTADHLSSGFGLKQQNGSENLGFHPFHPQIAILVRRISGQPTDFDLGSLRSKQTQTHNENHWEPTTHARVCNGDDESWVTRHLFLRLKHNYPHTIPQQNSRIWALLIRSHTSPTSGQKKVRIKVGKTCGFGVPQVWLCQNSLRFRGLKCMLVVWIRIYHIHVWSKTCFLAASI